jgi:hypothetical protein
MTFKRFFATCAILASIILTTAPVPLYAVVNSSGYTDAPSIVTCGQSTSVSEACKPTDIKKQTVALLRVVLQVGIPLLICFIIWRVIKAWFALQSGNTGAYKDALKLAGNGFLGLLFVVLVYGLFYGMIKYFKATGFLDAPLKAFFGFLATPAYAADGTFFKNPLFAADIPTLILMGVNFFMKFFVFPGLIVIWVWSGFAYVMAQGNPEKIKKANQWLFWALVSTVLVFTTQGFLYAVKNTIDKKILPASAITQNVSTDAPVNNTTQTPTKAGLGVSCAKLEDCQDGFVCTGTPGTCQRDTWDTSPTLCSSLTDSVAKNACFRKTVCRNIATPISEHDACLAVKNAVPASEYAGKTCSLITSESDRETCNLVQAIANSKTPTGVSAPCSTLPTAQQRACYIKIVCATIKDKTEQTACRDAKASLPASTFSGVNCDDLNSAQMYVDAETCYIVQAAHK